MGYAAVALVVLMAGCATTPRWAVPAGKTDAEFARDSELCDAEASRAYLSRRFDQDFGFHYGSAIYRIVYEDCMLEKGYRKP
jgi:hypothetical protein